MRQIPKNKILENQYTNGVDVILLLPNSKTPYIGFYNIINGVTYSTGKNYNDSSLPLEIYNLPVNLNNNQVKSIPMIGGISTSNNIRYFYKDLTSPKILIKEIDKPTYDQYVGVLSSTFQVISYNKMTQNLDILNNQMFGLKSFLAS
jgi:hypothetical protein